MLRQGLGSFAEKARTIRRRGIAAGLRTHPQLWGDYEMWGGGAVYKRRKLTVIVTREGGVIAAGSFAAGEQELTRSIRAHLSDELRVTDEMGLRYGSFLNGSIFICPRGHESWGV